MIEDSVEAMKSQARDTWALGDYEAVALRQQPIAEALCDWVGVAPGERVLDVGTATGNVALAAAARGAVTTGLDLTPRMLDIARARSAAEGYDVEYVLGDAEHLPHDDGSLDVALSACGLWFAPRPDRAVSEVRRVLRPSGRIGLANFTPTGYMGRLNELITSRLPLPDDVPEPNLWGREDVVRDRLAAFDDLRLRTDHLVYRFSSAAAATDFFASASPPHLAAATALGPRHAAELLGEIEHYTDATFSTRDGVEIPCEYLLVSARL